jgi:hypothetical protein
LTFFKVKARLPQTHNIMLHRPLNARAARLCAGPCVARGRKVQRDNGHDEVAELAVVRSPRGLRVRLCVQKGESLCLFHLKRKMQN